MCNAHAGPPWLEPLSYLLKFADGPREAGQSDHAPLQRQLSALLTLILRASLDFRSLPYVVTREVTSSRALSPNEDEHFNIRHSIGMPQLPVQVQKSPNRKFRSFVLHLLSKSGVAMMAAITYNRGMYVGNQ